MKLRTLFLLVFCLVLSGWIQAGTIYVNKNVSGGNQSGDSWGNAITELSDALTVAVSGDEVWVAVGTYYPQYPYDRYGEIDNSNIRLRKFYLPTGISIYGGFSGTESSLTQRNWNTYKTILSGDFAGTPGDPSDDAYQILYATGTNTIDGFIIRDGNNSDTSLSYPYYNGSGIYIDGTSTINNCIITENTGRNGAVYLSYGNVEINNSLIVANEDKGFSLSAGSGVVRNITFNNATIAGNNDVALNLGYGPHQVFLNNSIFYKNDTPNNYNNYSATLYLGCGSSGGGNPSSAPTITYQNIYLQGLDLETTPYQKLSSSSCNGGTISGTGGMNGKNVDNDPHFNADFSLPQWSPMINKGDNSLLPSSFTIDIFGNNRIYGGIIDLGAHECQMDFALQHSMELNVGSGQTQESLLNQTVGKGISIIPISFNVSNGATNAIVTGLPTGITGNLSGSVFTIQGSSTIIGRYPYTVTSTGSAAPSVIYQGIINIAPAPDSEGIIYVDKTKSGDGSSWNTAITELSEALYYANIYPPITQIRVAAGTYVPNYDLYFEADFTDPREKTFFVSGIELYGGFDPANGIVNLEDARDNSLTILSGDLGLEGRAYHVIIASGVQGDVAIDGFTIRDGLANGTNNYEVAQYNGAGAHLYSDYGYILFSNNIVIGNASSYSGAAGGGIHVYYSSNGLVDIKNNFITGNNVSGDNSYGGGIAISNFSSSINTRAIVRPDNSYGVLIQENEINGNESNGNYVFGGGIGITSSGSVEVSRGIIEPVVANVHGIGIVKNEITTNRVIGNSQSTASGGGIGIISRGSSEVRSIGGGEADLNIEVLHNLINGNEIINADYSGGAGIYLDTYGEALISNNVIVKNNASNNGGGVYQGRYTTAVVINNTIADNKAKSGGGLYEVSSSESFLANNIIWGNTAESGTEDLILLGNGELYNNLYDAAKISLSGSVNTNDNPVTADPLFIAFGSDNEYYNLLKTSPAINAGNTDLYVEIVGINSICGEDFMGNARIFGESIEIGAYEQTNAICPPVLVWTGAYGNSNWNHPVNWNPRLVPESCTDVYIPGNATIFPTLTGNIGDNVCDRIFFMQGAQLGRPDLLTYEEAHIQINYGKGSLGAQQTITIENLLDKVGNATSGRDVEITSQDRVAFGAMYSVPLDRGRWNMLAAPLANLVTGDFAFGGFPISYIRKFDPDGSESYIMGKWADFSGETDFEFQPGQGFGHYFFPYLQNTPYGMDNSLNNTQWEASKAYNSLTAPTPDHINGPGVEFGLAQTNGILHFPYFSDNYLSNAHRAHQYTGTPIAGTSTINFFYQSPLTSPNFMRWTGNSENIARNARAYRFITEGWNGVYNPGTFAAGDIVLVGNPYMSALDFERFYSANSSSIKQIYHIYQTTNTYVTYTSGSLTDAFIAPMQSFLVETAVDGNLVLNFDAESMAVTNTDTKLKSSFATDNKLTITARNEHGRISTWVRQDPDASDDFCNNDFSKLIDSPNNLPEIYTLVNRNSGQKRALLMNTIQSNDIVVPVGIVSTYDGTIMITTSGMNNYNAKVFFVDAFKNTEIEITGETEFEYAFEHTPSISSVLEGRFSLRFSPSSTTGMEASSVLNVTAYAFENDLMITSSQSNLIQLVSVYDLQGRRLAHEEWGGLPYGKISNVLQTRGVYIVRIHSEQGVKDIKIIR